jgi:hypothetical protein
MWSKRLGVRLALLPVVGFVIYALTLLYPLLYARYLLHELSNLRINRSTFEEAQKFATKLGAVPMRECTPLECRWWKVVTNARIPRWYRGKGVALAIIFEVQNSTVTEKAVAYEVGAGPSTPAGAFLGPPGIYVAETSSWFKRQAEIQRKLQKKSPGRFPDFVETPVDKGWSKIWYDQEGNVVSDAFRVDLSPRSTTVQEDWNKYTAFNYSCFWKYKGCDYGKDLLPIADPYPPHPSS